ncbi:MAG: SurA N-terminal domain-containing protein [Alphaproteobacteria bacterium]
MLSPIRFLVRNRPFQIVLGVLLAIGFISFGASGVAPSGRALVKMKGSDIKPRQFERYYQNKLQEYNLANLSIDEQKNLQLPQRFLQDLLLEELLAKLAVDMKLQISDKVVAQAIQKNPAFRDPATQQFSKDRYLAIIQQNGISEGVIIEQIKKNLSQTWLKNYFAALTFDTPNLLAVWPGRDANIAVDYISLDTKQLGLTIKNPTNDDLENFYQANASLYQKPNYRRFQILTLSSGDLKKLVVKKLVVSDADIKAAYQARRQEFIVPAGYQFAQWLFSDKTSADDFYRIYQKNPAQSLNQRPQNAKYNTITLQRHDLANYGLTTAEVGDTIPSVIETPFGFAVLHFLTKIGGAPKPLADVADALRADIMTKKTDQAFNNLYRLVNDQLASGKKFSEVLKDTGLVGRITATDFIDKQGRYQNGRYVANQPYLDDILEGGFSDNIKTAPLVLNQTDDNQNTNDENNLVAIGLLDNQPTFLPPFAEIKNQLLQDWQLAEAKKTLLVEKQNIDEQINKGTFDFDQYSSDKKLSAKRFYFSQQQILGNESILQNINNQQVVEVLFAAFNVVVSDKARLLIMRHIPSLPNLSQKNSDDFKQQFQAASTESWLLQLYQIYGVEVFWQRLDNLFN